jgi:hypothetical protein
VGLYETELILVEYDQLIRFKKVGV